MPRRFGIPQFWHGYGPALRAQSCRPTFYIYILEHTHICINNQENAQICCAILFLCSTIAVFSLVPLSLPLVLGEREKKTLQAESKSHPVWALNTCHVRESVCAEKWEQTEVFHEFPQSFLLLFSPPSLLPSDYLQGSSCHFLSPVTYHQCVCDHACSLASKCVKGCTRMRLRHHLPQIPPKWKDIFVDSFLAVSDVTIFTLQLLYLPLSSSTCSSSALPGFAGPTHT